MEDPKKCTRNTLTRREKTEWAIARKEERRDLGLVDGLRFETEEESHAYLRKREEEDAARRPGRREQTKKKRAGFAVAAEFKDRDPSYEKQKAMVAAMSRDDAKRVIKNLKKKYGGTIWPQDVCRLWKLLQLKAITVEAA